MPPGCSLFNFWLKACLDETVMVMQGVEIIAYLLLSACVFETIFAGKYEGECNKMWVGTETPTLLS